MGPTETGGRMGKQRTKGPVLVMPTSNQYAALDFSDNELSLLSIDVTLDFGQDNGDTDPIFEDNLSILTHFQSNPR